MGLNPFLVNIEIAVWMDVPKKVFHCHLPHGEKFILQWLAPGLHQLFPLCCASFCASRPANRAWEFEDGWAPWKIYAKAGIIPVLVKKIEHVTTLRLLLTNMLKIWSPGTETNPKAWWTKAETWPWERWDPSLSFLGQETKDQHVTDILVQNTMAIMIGPWQWRKRWTKRFFRFEYIAHQFKSYKDADDFPPSPQILPRHRRMPLGALAQRFHLLPFEPENKVSNVPRYPASCLGGRGPWPSHYQVTTQTVV